MPESIPSGLWCYRVDTGRSLLGGAINDVGRLVAWLRSTLRLVDDDTLLDAVLSPANPIARVRRSPFLSESAVPAGRAVQAVIAGLSAGTTAEAIFRASAEGVAISYARVVDQLMTVTGASPRLVASGRITQSVPHLLQLIADAADTPVHVAISGRRCGARHFLPWRPSLRIPSGRTRRSQGRITLIPTAGRTT